MTVIDETPDGQHARVAFVLDLAHPPEKVWRALTTPELVDRWLLPTVNMKLEAGAAFQFAAPPQEGWDGKVDCTCLEVTPHERLSYAWVVGDLDTVVTFTLTPTPAGTSLKIVQDGFTEGQKRNFGGARYGWRMMTGQLEAVLAETA